MFNRKWLTFRLSTLFLVMSSAAVVCGYPHIRRQIQFQRFKAYVGQDIRNLPESERESFSAIINDLIPDQPQGIYAILDGRENWFAWRLPTENGIRFVLFQGNPIWEIPSASGANIYLFDDWGRLVGQSSFSTGWRIDITDAAIISDEIKGESLIAVTTGPSIGGRSIAKQYYAFLDENVVLVRLEDKTGAFVGNEYWSHDIGPATIARTEGEWIGALNSSDPIELLRTLTWLAGKHNSPFRGRSERRLPVDIREYPEMGPVVDALTQNAHPWISEAALQLQQSLNVDR